jgi:hypothetical protein
MRSVTTKRFRQRLAALPASVQAQARDAYALFKQNPDHPSLRFKPVATSDTVYSVRIGKHYRALATRDGETLIWFWIGSHADDDRLVDEV